MELKDYIQNGIKKAGSVTALAQQLGLIDTAVTAAKGHRRGLPTAACYKLATMIEEDPARVVAASELVTEKDPVRRAIFAPFVAHAARVVLIATTACVVNAPTPAHANVTCRICSMYIM